MPAHSRTGNKTAALAFRVNESERDHINECAANAALTTGEYIRRAVLNRTIVHKADIQAVAHLRSFGGLLKHLHVTGGVGTDAQIESLLADIQATLKGIQ